MIELNRLELEAVTDPCVTTDLPIKQFDDDRVEALISMYLYQLKQLNKSTDADSRKFRLGQVEATGLVLTLLGFESQLATNDWRVDPNHQIPVISAEQVMGLIVLCVRAFDEYEWTRSRRASGRHGILSVVLVGLGQHRALNDVLEPPESGYWQGRN